MVGITASGPDSIVTFEVAAIGTFGATPAIASQGPSGSGPTGSLCPSSVGNDQEVHDHQHVTGMCDHGQREKPCEVEGHQTDNDPIPSKIRAAVLADRRGWRPSTAPTVRSVPPG
jgi:hypothetical protein